MAWNVREAAAVEAMGRMMDKNRSALVVDMPIDTMAESAVVFADALVKALSKGRVKQKRGTFVADNPPTVEEVETYCRERGNNVDPHEFVDHYISNGWKVGKNKTPMKDWKAAIRGAWERGDANTLGDWANGTF